MIFRLIMKNYEKHENDQMSISIYSVWQSTVSKLYLPFVPFTFDVYKVIFVQTLF